nr:FIVAR domain-containing protein [Gardnerella piotii]
MKYALKDDEPTGELSVGNMSGAYWIGNQKVSHSDEKLGDNQSIAGPYSWDPEAGPVTVAGKKDKIYKARLFVQPYAMTYYKDVYMESGRNPGNTAKAINVIFVPQTNHKTSDLKKSVGEHQTTKIEGKDVPTESKYYNASDKKKEAYDEALKQANEALKQAGDTEDSKLPENLKALIDNATINLNKARAELDGDATNKDGLNTSIEANGKVKNGKNDQGAQTIANADPAYQNATDDERKAYDDAVAAADKVSKDPNASQKEVNKAIEDLKKAKAALDAKATDKSKLITAEKLSFDNPDTTDASKQSTFYKNAAAKKGIDPAAKTAVENYDNALAKAREVLKNDKATQKEVDAAKDALTKAEDALHENYKSDANDLTKALADNVTGYLMPAYFNAFDKAQAGDKDAKKAFKDYNDAYQKAKELKKKFAETETSKQPTAEEIKTAKEALENARKVIDKYATNTSKLSAAAFNDLAIQNSPAYKNVSADDASAEAKAAKQKYDDAVTKLHQALNKQMPKDKDKTTGQDIPDTNIPVKDGNLDDKDYLKDIQAHAKGEPLDRDITKILKEMNDAAAELNKFATKTDELLKSVNEDAATHQNPAFKNASQPSYKNDDGSDNTDKNNAAKAAADAYGDALNAAKELLKNPAATQKEVNDALKKLDDARKELDKYNTDTTKLKESVKKHGSTEGSAPTEGTQTSDAYRNASDPHFMKEEGGKLVPDDNKNKQAAAAKKAYDDALTKAQELLKKHDDNATPQDAKPTQKDVNDALKALDEARTKLDDYKTDTTALNTEAEKSKEDAEGASATGKFEDSPEFKNADGKETGKDDVKAYKDALKKARELVKAATEQGKKNSERPTQQQVDEALEALKNAKKQITDNYKTNAAALKAAKDFAAGDFKKTPEYKNADALKGDQNADAEKKNAAKDAVDALDKNTNGGALNNAIGILQAFDDDGKPKQGGTTGARIPTQKEVDDALKTLQEAMNKVTNNYKTNADKLKNEVGDKDENGKDVNPPFEASVPYKNALEKAKTETDKTSDTSATKKLEDYNKKLKAAQDLIAQVNSTDPNADPDKKPTQAQVDAALKALQEAKNAIKDAFATNAKALKDESAKSTADGATTVGKDDFEATTEFKNADAKKGDDGKENADVTAYKDALGKARNLLNKFDQNGKPNSGEKDVPTQKEVDEALKNLKEIKDKITKNYVTSPHDLYKEVDKSKDGDTDTNTDVFENTPEFKNVTAKGDEAAKKDLQDYNDKLKAAKKLLDKFDRTTGKPKTLPAGEKAPTQQELDKALKDLQDAKKKITEGYKTNKSDLNTEAGKDSDFTKTPEFQNAAGSLEADAYKKALEEANKVLGDENATQAQVDEALKKLKQAKDDLTSKHRTNKNKLYQETGNDPEFRKSIPFLIADGKDIAEYNKALNDANAVLADPNATQAQVDEALRKLQAIKQKMIDFYNSLGSGSDDDSDGNNNGTGANNANAANAVDKSMLSAEVNGALADIANGNGAAGASNGANGNKGALVDASVIKEFNDALENARRVLADPNATQEQVEAATMRLRAARAALNAAKANKGSNLRGNMGVQTGVDSATLSAFAAVFVGLAGLGVSAKRRKHASK